MQYLHQWRPLNLCSLALVALTGNALAGVAMTDQPFVGQTWVVACKKLPLHAAPTGYSKTVAVLNYHDHVKIEKLDKKYDLPDSQQDRNANSDSDNIMAGGGKEYFAWAEVAAPGGKSGYVPLNCLVNGSLMNGPHENPDEYAKQTLSLTSGTGAPEAAVSSRGFSKKEKGDKVAMRGMSSGGGVQECTAEQLQANANAPDGAVSARGFSKKEKGDKVAMRGMSAPGGNVCIKEDYAGLKTAIQSIPFVVDPYNADMAFRREGGLGEFK